MTKVIQIDPRQYPLKTGESWWVVHPNSGGSEFKIPHKAVTVCTENFLQFKSGTVYAVTEGKSGWVDVWTTDFKCEMPQYIFARHFDAEAFVVGRARPDELEKAKPFNYQPTVPAPVKAKPRQLDLFEDIPGGLGE